jgi:hypothetical protein
MAMLRIRKPGPRKLSDDFGQEEKDELKIKKVPLKRLPKGKR